VGSEMCIRDSNNIALEDTNDQLNQAVALYKKVKDLQSKVAELESTLEIAQLNNHFLKEELEQHRTTENNNNSDH
jgi:hypothetical protein